MKIIHFLLILTLVSCGNSSNPTRSETTSIGEAKPSVQELYFLANVNDSIESTSVGTVARGSLQNGTLIPFEGSNYKYFATESYIGGRAYTHSKVAKTVLETYESLETQGVDRLFQVMEFSRKEGGKIFPHRTHQNGLSVDFMMPLQKNGAPCYDYDNMGASHYLMDFNKDGIYNQDTEVSIDFNMTARHILELQKQAKKNNLTIQKVIFNTNLKDELFATPYGKKLRTSGIYITRNLEPLINDLHDDHYHVDFVIIR